MVAGTFPVHHWTQTSFTPGHTLGTVEQSHTATNTTVCIGRPKTDSSPVGSVLGSSTGLYWAVVTGVCDSFNQNAFKSSALLCSVCGSTASYLHMAGVI